MTEEISTAPPSVGGDRALQGEPSAEAGAGSPWSRDKQGREYVPAKGRSGLIYRKGGESLDEAYARDSKGPKDKRPKRKQAPTVPKAPAPTQSSLKELEFLVAEALKAPAMICIALGDEWPANHMMNQAPVFARNLTKAAEHNPWLRSKLEAAVTGEDFMVKVLTTGAVGGAAFMYLVPVLMYYFKPGFVPDQAAELLGVPDRDELRRKQEAEHAAQAAQSAARTAATGPVAAAA